jgi:hypothetical protein
MRRGNSNDGHAGFHVNNGCSIMSSDKLSPLHPDIVVGQFPQMGLDRNSKYSDAVAD